MEDRIFSADLKSCRVEHANDRLPADVKKEQSFLLVRPRQVHKSRTDGWENERFGEAVTGDPASFVTKGNELTVCQWLSSLIKEVQVAQQETGRWAGDLFQAAVV